MLDRTGRLLYGTRKTTSPSIPPTNLARSKPSMGELRSVLTLFLATFFPLSECLLSEIPRHLLSAQRDTSCDEHQPMFFGGQKRTNDLLESYLPAVDNVVPRKGKERKKRSQKKRIRTPKTITTCTRDNKFVVDLATQLCYARNGHACTRQLLPISKLRDLRTKLLPIVKAKELEAWRQKVEVAADTRQNSTASLRQAQQLAASCATISDCQNQLRRLLHVDGNVQVPFLQFFNTWRQLPLLLPDFIEPILAPTARQLLDLPPHIPLRLYQDAVFWKRSGDGMTPWHSDAPMAPFDTRHLITAWIPLHHNNESLLSGLSFCSQSHIDMAWAYWREQSNTGADLSARYPPDAIVDYGPLRWGDVTWHSGWTLHCAAPGAVEERLALAVTFCAANAPIRPDAATTGDREDATSYREWIDDVIAAGGVSDDKKGMGNEIWEHPLVPIVG